MQGSLVRFYLGEQQRHHGVLLWEWLLEKANAAGIPGGCAFRAIGGFGRHRAVHEERFFELAGSAGVYEAALAPLGTGRWLFVIEDEARSWRMDGSAFIPAEMEITIDPNI